MKTPTPLLFHQPLNATALRSHGITSPWAFGLADRVRFGEIDALGHVNHTAYLRWFESFRLPYLQARHVSDYGPTSPRLVLKQVHCTCRNEMVGGEDYIVTGRTCRFRTTSFTMDFAVWRITLGMPPQCTADGGAIVVLLNRDAPGRYPIPQAGRAAFETEDGATPEG